MEAANSYREGIQAVDKSRFNEWNGVVREVKSILLPKLERITTDLMQKHSLPQSFRNDVEWDLVHYCTIIEYDDVRVARSSQGAQLAAELYTTLGKWYSRGHFPCGWEGEWPRGILLLY